MGLALSPRAGWSVILFIVVPAEAGTSPSSCLRSQRMRGMAGMLLSNDSRRPCNRMQRAVLAKPLFPFASTRNALSTSASPACQCGRGAYGNLNRGGQGRRDGRRPRHSSPNPSFQRRLESRAADRPHSGGTAGRGTSPTRHSSGGWNPERPTGHTAGRWQGEQRHPLHQPTPRLQTRHSSPNPSFQRRLESRVANRPHSGDEDITGSHRRGRATQGWTPLSA